MTIQTYTESYAMVKLKCLALWQPWATLVIEGLKLIETRPYYSPYRGPAGIHATLDNAKHAAQNERLFYSEPFYSRLKDKGYTDWKDLPRGGIIGEVEITDWLKIVNRKPIHPKVEMNPPFSSMERAFGNYELGRHGVPLTVIKKFESLFPATGKQGLFFDVEVPDYLLK